MVKFNNLWNKVPRKGKVISLLALTALLALPISKCGATTGEAVYLVDLEDKYQNEAVLLDENGNELVIDTDDRSQLVAIVDSKSTKKGKDYPVVLVNEEGEYTRGYMDGKYLDDDVIDSVSVKHDLFKETSVVIPESGLWLRNNDDRVIDHYTDDAYLLSQGDSVMTSTIYETSKDNSYKWKEAVHYNREDNSLERGYLVGDYVYNSDYNQIQGKRFVVSNTSGNNLKLRSGASIDSDKIGEFPEGTEVVLLPGISSVSYDNRDWFYVAVQTSEGVKTGYMAASWYRDDEVINYLVEVGKEDIIDVTSTATNKIIMKVVDTKSANYVPLKLRSKPTKDGEIISELDHGTIVYTYQQFLDDAVSADGYNWVKVSLTNGDVGYVADTYIKDRVENDNMEISQYVDTVDFGNEGSVEGYYGIDVKNTADYNGFEKLITGKIDFDCEYNTGRNLSSMSKPQFVIFKLGASYTNRSYENAVLVDNVYDQLDNLKKLTALCEKYQIPYGFYFYSQATSELDIQTETEFVKYALDVVGGSTYNILPFAYDVEEFINYQNQNIPTRAKDFVDKYGRSALTEIGNKWMNKVREDNGVDVVIYAAHSCFGNMIKYNEFDEVNQQNIWAVDPSNVHSDYLMEYTGVVENISVRQIALDSAGSHNIDWDVDFINKEYLESLLNENGLLESNERILIQ